MMQESILTFPNLILLFLVAMAILAVFIPWFIFQIRDRVKSIDKKLGRIIQLLEILVSDAGDGNIEAVDISEDAAISQLAKAQTKELDKKTKVRVWR